MAWPQHPTGDISPVGDLKNVPAVVFPARQGRVEPRVVAAPHKERIDSLAQAIECFAAAASELTGCKVLIAVREQGLESSTGSNARDQMYPVALVGALKQILAVDSIAGVTAAQLNSACSGQIGPSGQHHGIVGRLPIDATCQLFFLGGWRPQPFEESELGSFERSLGIVWRRICRPISNQAAGLTVTGLLAAYSSPVFVVRHDLRLLATNSSGEQVLAARKPLQVVGGTLAAHSRQATARLVRAAREFPASRACVTGGTAIIPLSPESGSYEFVWIRRAPIYLEANDLFVFMPPASELAAARRIAEVFGLPCAHEKIVGLILLGYSTNEIVTTLNFTEATVRTYTKRVMAKLGISGRADLFRLAMLTRSPLGERSVNSELVRADSWQSSAARSRVRPWGEPMHNTDHSLSHEA